MSQPDYPTEPSKLSEFSGDDEMNKATQPTLYNQNYARPQVFGKEPQSIVW